MERVLMRGLRSREAKRKKGVLMTFLDGGRLLLTSLLGGLDLIFLFAVTPFFSDFFFFDKKSI